MKSSNKSKNHKFSSNPTSVTVSTPGKLPQFFTEVGEFKRSFHPPYSGASSRWNRSCYSLSFWI